MTYSQRYTCAVYDEHGNTLEGLGRESDIPIGKDKFDHAVKYVQGVATRTKFARGKVVNSSDFTHESGVLVHVNERNGNPKCTLETISFFSTTETKIRNLVEKAGLKNPE